MPQYCNPENLSSMLTSYWSPNVIATFDDYYIKLAKLKDSLAWHCHHDQDEVFFILSGELLMEYRGKTIQLFKGDLHIVPKGVEHNPVAKEECVVMLIEHKKTKHTGDVIHRASRSIEEQLSHFLAQTEAAK